MAAAVADHLWQSLLFFLAGASLVWLAHGHAAFLRLWLWRVCALKFLVPFALVFALGQWLGFPRMHSGDPLPGALVRATEVLNPWLAPAQAAVLPLAGVYALLASALAAAVGCIRLSRRRQDVELARSREEAGRIEAAGDDAPPALGFFKAALITSCAIWTCGMALVAGAIHDGLRRDALLLENSRALHDAVVTMLPAAPGMGTRTRIVARDDGVLIRNINLQNLIAVSYGVSHFSVSSNQMYPGDSDPGRNSWMLSPFYDVRISARIRAPEDFDPYALRQRMTRLLVERFGLEIHVNGQCQRPCGRWDTAR